MLVVRLIFVLLVITAMVFLGLYVIKHQPIYLNYFKRTVLYALYIIILVAVLVVLRRLI
jgi:hypothetical protein